MQGLSELPLNVLFEQEGAPPHYARQCVESTSVEISRSWLSIKRKLRKGTRVYKTLRRNKS